MASEGFMFRLVRTNEDGLEEIIEVSNLKDGLNFYETVGVIEKALKNFGFCNDMDDYVKSKYV